MPIQNYHGDLVIFFRLYISKASNFSRMKTKIPAVISPDDEMWDEHGISLPWTTRKIRARPVVFCVNRGRFFRTVSL
jgi:hypothetical protein